MTVKTNTKKVKKSKLPYEVSTSTIGEIINAKALMGDVKASKAVKYFAIKVG